MLTETTSSSCWTTMCKIFDRKGVTLSSSSEFVEDRRVCKRTRDYWSDDDSPGCAPLTASCKRTRLDLDSEGSEIEETDYTSDSDSDSDDDVTPLTFTAQIPPLFSGPSYKVWRSSSGAAPATVSLPSEPPAALVCRKKIEEKKLERVVDILCLMIKKMKI